MLEMQLCGAGDKLNAARAKVKSDFDKIPTGPMTIMSADYGCIGAKLAMGGGAGLMVGGMIMKDGAMFTAGAAFWESEWLRAAAFSC
jgi:hypothetical protein